jgi:hypothetical protein
LELAAELGRGLLERNEELEKELKATALLNDDQAQEIQVGQNSESLSTLISV